MQQCFCCVVVSGRANLKTVGREHIGRRLVVVSTEPEMLTSPSYRCYKLQKLFFFLFYFFHIKELALWA